VTARKTKTKRRMKNKEKLYVRKLLTQVGLHKNRAGKKKKKRMTRKRKKTQPEATFQVRIPRCMQ
jgi:hypothetical protein